MHSMEAAAQRTAPRHLQLVRAKASSRDAWVPALQWFGTQTSHMQRPPCRAPVIYSVFRRPIAPCCILPLCLMSSIVHYSVRCVPCVAHLEASSDALKARIITTSAFQALIYRFFNAFLCVCRCVACVAHLAAGSDALKARIIAPGSPSSLLPDLSRLLANGTPLGTLRWALTALAHCCAAWHDDLKREVGLCPFSRFSVAFESCLLFCAGAMLRRMARRPEARGE